MKNNSFDFIFIHGWGFDKLIWQNITNLIIKENFCSSVFCIDLNFFSKGKGEIFKSRTTKKTIVITHSYGLHWFLKNKIECEGLINLFGSPDFTAYQVESKKKKTLLKKMIKNFKNNPEKVLQDFYSKCNLKFNKSSINFENLLNSLNYLYEDKLEREFFKIKFKIMSYYIIDDPIFTPSEEKIQKLKKENHEIEFIKNKDHLFPMNQPKKTLNFIKKFIKTIYVDR